MRIHVFALTAALNLLPFAAVAGPGHDHGHSHEAITQAQAEAIAVKSVGRLVSNGKVDKSWETIKASTIEKKVFGGTQEWVVVFNNAGVADAEKRNLYIFLSVNGEYLAANHTGK